MRVALVNPPMGTVYSSVSASLGKSPPVGLASLAAYVRAKGFEVRVLDAAVMGAGFDDIEHFLRAGFDVVGVGAMTPSLDCSAKVLRLAKQVNGGCVTVMGGPHLSAVPEETLRALPEVDFGVVGEGEVTFHELLDCLRNGGDASGIPGLVFRDGGQVRRGPRRALIADLDSLPLPAYDLLPMDRYSMKIHHVWSSEKVALRPYTDLFTSRGCPYRCTFCASHVVWGRTVRFRSAEHVLREIDFLVARYGVKAIEICDDLFTINKPRLHAILAGLAQRKSPVSFTCMSRVDTVDRETLEMLKAARFRLIRFGVESCSQPILDAMRKGTTVADVRRAFHLAKEVGLAASACVMIGYPGETRETFAATLRVLREIDPVAVDFFITIPIIGSELYELARQNGYLANEDWSNWTLIPRSPALGTPQLPAAELKGLLKTAYLRFYFRPRFILRCLRRIYSWENLVLLAKGFKALLSVMLSRRQGSPPA